MTSTHDGAPSASTLRPQPDQRSTLNTPPMTDHHNQREAYARVIDPELMSWTDATLKAVPADIRNKVIDQRNRLYGKADQIIAMQSQGREPEGWSASEFGQRLRETAAARMFSQRMAAADAGVSVATFNRVARGHEPSVSVYFALKAWMAGQPAQPDRREGEVLREALTLASAALDELQERASRFSVSGVYFDEPVFKENVAALAKASAAEDAVNRALSQADAIAREQG